MTFSNLFSFFVSKHMRNTHHYSYTRNIIFFLIYFEVIYITHTQRIHHCFTTHNMAFSLFIIMISNHLVHVHVNITFSQDVNASKIFSEEAAQIYERAISGPLRKNQLLYFAYADFEESRLRYPEVHKIYQRYIEMEDIDPTLVSIFPWYINVMLITIGPVLIVVFSYHF